MKKRQLWALAAAVGLTSCDSPTPTPTPPPPPANRAPVFTSPSTATASEASTASFYTAAASDPDSNPLTFTISGGADAALFDISAAGALSFKAGASFSNPRDADGDNVYQVTLSVSDGQLTATQALQVSIAPTVGELQFYLRGKASGPLGCIANEHYYRYDRVYFVLRDGQVSRNTGSGAVPTTALVDLSSEVAPNGIIDCTLGTGNAFSGDFYVYLIISLVTRAGDLEVRAYQVMLGSLAIDRSPEQVRASERVLFRVPRLAATGNYGGGLHWDSNTLYAAFGDMGNPDAAQDPASMAGKLVRFPQPLLVAPSTPGTPTIIASGLRNPATLSTNTINGVLTLFVGDRGVEREEVNMMPDTASGVNFGWPYLDGTRVARAGGPAGMAPPVIEYDHGTGARQGQAVVVGTVFSLASNRPTPEFFFGDRSSGNIWSVAVSRLVPGRTLPGSQFVLQRPAMSVRPNAIDFPDAPNTGAIGLPIAIHNINDPLTIVDEDGELFERNF